MSFHLAPYFQRNIPKIAAAAAAARALRVAVYEELKKFLNAIANVTGY